MYDSLEEAAKADKGKGLLATLWEGIRMREVGEGERGRGKRKSWMRDEEREEEREGRGEGGPHYNCDCRVKA